MPLPQHLRYQQGGNIAIDTTQLPTGASVKIVSSSGAALMTDQTATISTINVALASAPSAGDTAFSVDANTGLSVGQKCWIQDVPEEILVKKVAGTNITTWRPLLYDHINTARVEGGRVTFAVDSDSHAVANTLFWDGHAEWNIDSQSYFTAIECTRYPMQRIATSNDLADIEPKIYDILDDEVSVNRLLDLGHDKVLMLLAKASPDTRVRVFVGSTGFKTATCFAALWYHYMSGRSEDSQEIADRYEKALASELEGIVQVIPRDTDQDKTVEADERISTRTVRLVH